MQKVLIMPTVALVVFLATLSAEAQTARRFGGAAAMGVGRILLLTSNGNCDDFEGGAISDFSLAMASPSNGRCQWTLGTARRDLRSVAAERTTAGILWRGVLEKLDDEYQPRNDFRFYSGIGAMAAGAVAAFWPGSPVDVAPDIRNNGVRVSKSFGW